MRVAQIAPPYVLVAIFVSICCVSKTRAVDQRAPVEVMVLCAPTPVRAEGKFHLVYELHITNFGQKDVTLTKVEVLGDKSGSPILTYEGSQLGDELSTPGRTTSEKTRLGGGQRLVVFIWVSVNSVDAIPGKLRHRLSFTGSSADGHSVEMSVVAGETPIREKTAIAIRPPLQGGPWRAQNGPSNDSIHRRSPMAIEGRTYDAQRFAIDWVKLGTKGKGCRADCDNNEDHYSYGSEILAVADGTVSEVVDNIPDNIPGSVPPEKNFIERAPGNHIVLDLGTGHYALYAHMQPGKMQVHRGDHVHAGEVLGLIGNSGRSTGPHLDFHLMDGPSPLGSEGLPFVLDCFEVNGRTHTMEMPLDNMVMQFPNWCQR
jgi:murein DD-endopeptidase